MRVGDVSRSRRFADPARQRWYAFHRAVRFAVRMRQAQARAVVAKCSRPEMSVLFLAPCPAHDLHPSTGRHTFQITPGTVVEVC